MAIVVVTGGAGFIGSNLVKALVARGDTVRVIDDLSSGHRHNLEDVSDEIAFYEGSIEDETLLEAVFTGAEGCFHQAAVASVPRSVTDPIGVNQVNVQGTLRVFRAAYNAGMRRVVFASSSSVYGDTAALPATEDLPLQPTSPYGADKASDELYGAVFSGLYPIDIVALRYFNVFGPHQDPKSEYAAVIPIFISRMMHGERPIIFGDGTQTRDFCFVENVVAANLCAWDAPGSIAGRYNIGMGRAVSLLDLVNALNTVLGTSMIPEFAPSRTGDILHSYGDITRAREALGYAPAVDIEEGLRRTVEWYRTHQ